MNCSIADNWQQTRSAVQQKDLFLDSLAHPFLSMNIYDHYMVIIYEGPQSLSQKTENYIIWDKF